MAGTPPQNHPQAYSVSSFSNANLPPLKKDPDTNHQVIPDASIDVDDLKNAEIMVMKEMESMHRSPINQGVKREAVKSEEFRYEAARGGHIAANNNNNLGLSTAAIIQCIDRLEARTNAKLNNEQIRRQNRQYMVYPELLQKTVSGNGLHHVQKIMDPKEYQNIVLPESQIGPGDVPSMGPDFKIYSCTKLDIAKLMYFYNEDFNITSEDRHDLDLQRFKFIKWLIRD